MPITAVCPKCKSKMQLASFPRGTKVLCQECGTAMIPEHHATAVDPSAPTLKREEASNLLTLEEIGSLWERTVQDVASPDVTIKSKGSGAETQSGIAIKPHKVTDKPVEPPADYELLDTIGEGGMGVVYSARQTSIDRTIALKMIKVEDAEAQKKFLCEAAVTGDLEHPNIVPVYDLGANEQGQIFYAMKRVKGIAWKDVIQKKTQAENIEILLRVADAVAFAHSKGVVHRDLKPENVMLGDFGEVLVMDWGLALSIMEGGKAERISKETVCAGTPAYMAPEMAAGDPRRISHASDIYLLGAILYEIVTGQRPHTGENVMQCIWNAANNVIQPAEAKGELVGIALKAMATDPAQRYPSVKDFQTAIRDYQAHSESIGLATRAQEDLARAEQTKYYDSFAQALFGFREALELWPENKAAADGVVQASLAYAQCAFDKGDLDLAVSLLGGGTFQERKLLKDVTDA